MADYYGIDTVVSELREDGLLIIRINRPEVANALNGVTSKAMENIMNNAETDPAVRAIIVTGTGKVFCAGEDLSELSAGGECQTVTEHGFGGLTARLCSKPVIAACNGSAAGGGMEIALSCDMVVANENAKFGCTEVGLGIIASTGGLVRLARDINRKDCMELLLTGKKIKAPEAKELGLVRKDDVVAFNAFELLHIAKQEALALAERGYRPPLPGRRIQVAGDVGIATFKMMLVNMLEGRFISPHDYEIATRIASVLCGGEIDRGSLVDEAWLLRLEREHFVALAQMPKTQERIAHMLKTGKPLRN